MEGGIRVLYVDDEPALLDIARLFLEQNGDIEVTISTSAKAALDLPGTPVFDLIISDYQMPGMDGIVFLKEVRQRFGDIPFILFTGRGREEVVIDAINNGADFYLQKGGDPTAQFAELAHKIRQAVLRKRSDLSRVKAERSLRESEELLRLFIGHAPVALAMLDKELRYIAASSRWMADYHLGNRELTGQSHLEVFPELTEEIRDVLRRGLAGEESSANEDMFERQDGSVQWLSWEVHPWYTAGHDVGGVIIFSEDITDRKKAEDLLRESEEKYRSFVETSPDIIWEISPQGTVLFVSPQIRAVMGYTPEEITGRSLIDLMPEEAKLFAAGELKRLFSREGPLPTFEVPALHHDGHTVVLKIRPSLTGKHEGFRGVAVDITEQKRAEAALQKSQFLLSEAMDMAHMADWELDALTGVFTFNDRFYALYGTTAGREGGYLMPAEVYAREFTYPDDQSMVGEEIEKALSTPKSGYFSVREHRILRRDGEVRWITVRIRVSKDAQGRTIKTHGANQDITERKRAEEALRQANNKLNLLSGITRHDIKNQLLTLDSFITLLRRKIPDPVYDTYFSRITAASSQIANLIHFTKEYEQLGMTVAVWQDIGKIAKMAAVDLLPESVHLSVEPEHCEIFADPMFMLVLYNFFDNARRHGDHVTGITIRMTKEGTSGMLIIEDNGIGIPAEIKEQIFERGFGKNTGLGLFLIREILSITGASIRETGTEGKGARFEILLPPGTWRRNPGETTGG